MQLNIWCAKLMPLASQNLSLSTAIPKHVTGNDQVSNATEPFLLYLEHSRQWTFVTCSLLGKMRQHREDSKGRKKRKQIKPQSWYSMPIIQDFLSGEEKTENLSLSFTYIVN